MTQSPAGTRANAAVRHSSGDGHKKRFRNRYKAGYTLIELLVVLTIISLIVGLVGPRVLGYLGQSRVKTAKLQIEGFGSALDLFYMDNGRYPTTSEGLDALEQRPSNAENWNGPYIKGSKVPLDPWGHPYHYRSSTDRLPPYEIISLGPDGREGADNISNVEK
jgi:general secretion pathway protein G